MDEQSHDKNGHRKRTGKGTPPVRSGLPRLAERRSGEPVETPIDQFKLLEIETERAQQLLSDRDLVFRDRIVVEPSQLLQRSNVHLNIEQEFIVVTDDKLRLCLKGKVEALAARHAWVAPAGIFVTLLAALLTTSFRDVWLKREVWEAIFWLCALGSLVWLIFSVISALRAPTLDSLVEEIKKGT